MESGLSQNDAIAGRWVAATPRRSGVTAAPSPRDSHAPSGSWFWMVATRASPPNRRDEASRLLLRRLNRSG
jgi:hypothetical protein